jgi:hypothetical protein
MTWFLSDAAEILKGFDNADTKQLLPIAVYRGARCKGLSLEKRTNAPASAGFRGSPAGSGGKMAGTSD